jgi:hypothetical protein
MTTIHRVLLLPWREEGTFQKSGKHLRGIVQTADFCNLDDSRDWLTLVYLCETGLEEARRTLRMKTPQNL